MNMIDFAGNVVGGYQSTHAIYNSQQQEQITQPAHHIVVVDASGSMYYSMQQIRDILSRALSAEEFLDTGVRFSFISYSTRGDVRLHFANVAAKDLEGHPLNEIRNLQVRGLTCISQALREAINLVNPDEVTAITLHSDGYANDPGFRSEREALLQLCGTLPPTAFVNTIAYTDWSDFRLLDEVATAGGGVCVRASTPNDVFTCVRDTSILLSKNVLPALHVPAEGADFVAVVGNGKFVLEAGDVTVRGVTPGTAYNVYRFTKGDDGVVVGTAAAVLARGFLRMGRIQDAKFLMNGYSGDFMRDHAKALTTNQIANFASALDAIIEGQELGPSAPYVMDGTTVQDIIHALYDDAIRINMTDLRANYRKRSVGRVAGVRNEAGEVVPPLYDTRPVELSEYMSIQGVEYSRGAATLNMRFAQSVELFNRDSGESIKEVAGIPLNLRSYHNYTVIGSGDLNLSTITFRVAKKSVFQRLESMGIVSGTFNPEADYVVDLSAFPITTFGREYKVSTQDVKDLMHLQVLKSFLSAAVIKGASEYSPEQIEALAAYHITPSLNFSPPTTTPYTDRNAAIAAGEIDILPEYTCNFGIRGIASTSQLHSANAFMKRFYEIGGEKDVTVPDLRGNSGTATRKALSARTKVTEVDTFMASIFDPLLGINTDSTIPFLSADAAETILDRTFDNDVLTEALREVEAAMDRIINRLTPVVFYIGASGDIPSFDGGAQIMTGEEFAKAYPNTKASKAELEGMFVVLNGGEVTINVAESTRDVSRKTA